MAVLFSAEAFCLKVVLGVLIFENKKDLCCFFLFFFYGFNMWLILKRESEMLFEILLAPSDFFRKSEVL